MFDDDNSAYNQLFAYVKSSRNRQEIIKIIASNKKIPSDIVDEMDVRFSLVSRVLKDLKEHGIVKCINEEAKVGRLYKLTDIGLLIYYELISE